MSAQIKDIKDHWVGPQSNIPNEWKIKLVMNNQCMGYVAWNEKSKEALVVDPEEESFEEYKVVIESLKGYHFLGVIDTHCHADHISCADLCAQIVSAPLIMSKSAKSTRVQKRVATENFSSIQFLLTPGHTSDGMVVSWGPFLFCGDTVLFGDTGRDDLPTGSPEEHHESLQKIKSFAHPKLIFLPGHDHKGGRICLWSYQLEVNASLKQDRETFVRESRAFKAPPPQNLEEALRENTK